MGWATNAVSAAMAKLGGLFGRGSSIPTMPIISIGEGFYEQAVLVANGIERVETSFKSFREPITLSVSKVIIPSIRQNFDSEGRPSWKALSKNTVTQRGSAHPILNVTGNLKNEATSQENWQITDDEAWLNALDSKVKYAKYHQDGTRNMPAREFVSFQEKDRTDIELIFSKWVDEKIQRGGFR